MPITETNSTTATVHSVDLSNLVDALEYSIYKKAEDRNVFDIIPINFNDESNLTQLINEYDLDFFDLQLIALAYAWEYQPNVLHPLVLGFNEAETREHFGGKLDRETAKFFPDLKTFIALFFPKEERQSAILKYTSDNYCLIKYGIITFSKENYSGEGRYNQRIHLSVNYVQYLMGGSKPRLDHEPDFPARLLTTKVAFDDIIHTDQTKDDLHHIKKYMSVRPVLKTRPELKKKINTTHIIVFSGSPGTGKSLTATSLGQEFELPTYTLDLSRVLSRYVGDFEKAMERVFSRLEGRDCILFIDEADSIFTKRQEEVKETKDKYSNQEMSYLLQRLERFEGIVILATNVQDIRSHLDKAMLRRISTIIEFPFPKQPERQQLWEKALPEGFTYDEGVLEKISTGYQLTGANISNIISGVIIEALYNNVTAITFEMLEPIMQKEYFKRDSRFMYCTDDSPAAALMEQRLGRSAVHSGRRM
ncbi:ATP-binding protein [Flammeovirga sp. MY04]|uniref:ATP-binding protein n=1 Tax=Flammeovirga sp. MY04 TaxID=1191459 RepID=UPI0008063E2F|nr:ATP-binding protein [Flammeovirga sp. MY04]ANQ51482.1 ATP-binding protein [Flammeovirga sp. MY04]